jgi:hypothetical protein
LQLPLAVALAPYAWLEKTAVVFCIVVCRRYLGSNAAERSECFAEVWKAKTL